MTVEPIDASRLSDAELLFLAANEQCPFDPIASALHGDRLPQTWGRWVAEPLLRELARRLEILAREFDIQVELRNGEAERATIAERERDAILRWSIRHAGYIGMRYDSDRSGWWAIGDNGRITGKTAEEVIRKAAGLDRETREQEEPHAPRSWPRKVTPERQQEIRTEIDRELDGYESTDDY